MPAINMYDVATSRTAQYPHLLLDKTSGPVYDGYDFPKCPRRHTQTLGGLCGSPLAFLGTGTLLLTQAVTSY